MDHFIYKNELQSIINNPYLIFIHYKLDYLKI